MARRVEDDDELFDLWLVVAGCAVISFEMVTQFLAGMLASVPFDAVGFTQNRNAFAFQCLMMLCAAIALPNRNTVFIGFAMAGIWLSASRAGIGAGVAIVLFSAVAFSGFLRKAVDALVVAIAMLAIQPAAPYVIPVADQIIAAVKAAFGTGSGGSKGHARAAVIANSTLARLMAAPSSDASLGDHLTNMAAAWRLFLEYPIFGAGLGSFFSMT